MTLCRALTACLAMMLPSLALAQQAPNPGWIADPRSGCKVWNVYPEPGEVMNWSGTCRDGFAEGRGIVQYSHGSQPGGKYEGNYRQGKLQGRGAYVYRSGARYEGEFAESQFNGKGVETYTNGARYEGDFRSDLRHGQGTYRYANGAFYVGQWSNGKPHGQGTLTQGARAYTGLWSNGCFRQGDDKIAVIVTAKECGF